jgi:hypothetical protein
LYRVSNPFEALPGFEGLAEGVGLKIQEEPKRVIFFLIGSSKIMNF